MEEHCKFRSTESLKSSRFALNSALSPLNYIATWLPECGWLTRTVPARASGGAGGEDGAVCRTLRGAPLHAAGLSRAELGGIVRRGHKKRR